MCRYRSYSVILQYTGWHKRQHRSTAFAERGRVLPSTSQKGYPKGSKYLPQASPRSQKEFQMPSVRPTSLEQDQGPRKIKFPRVALPSKSPKESQRASRQHPGHLRVANSIGRLERSLKRPNFVRITQNSGQCSESRWKFRNKSKGVVAFPCSKSKKNLQKRPKMAQNSRRSYPQQ